MLFFVQKYKNPYIGAMKLCSSLLLWAMRCIFRSHFCGGGVS